MKLLIPLLLLASGGPPRELAVRVMPPEPVQGQLLVIQVEGTLAQDRVQGYFDKRPIRFFRDGNGRVRGLTAVPLYQSPGEVPLVVTVVLPGGDPLILGAAVAVRAGAFEEQSLTVDPGFVRPPPQERSRIRKERDKMSSLWRAEPTRRMWRGSFVWPREDQICSSFGMKRMFNRRLRSRHYGLDIDGKPGDAVLAAGAGRVVMVASRYYSGGTVVVDHGQRLFSLYFHLSVFEVKPGDWVAKGQLIGRVGTSGRVTGPHLHLETRVEGISFDPLSLLDLDLTETKER